MMYYDLKGYVIELLEKRGVTINDIAELVLFLQEQYRNDLTIEDAIENVEAVLDKREVQNTIITGINLDILAEEGKLLKPLNELLGSDHPLYGVDEVLAYSIVNVYGSIGYTSFGYIDKIKPGIIEKVDREGKQEGVCNTFLDDIIGGIASAAASRIAHNKDI